MGRRVTGLATLVLLAVAGAACSRARTDSQITTDVKARMYSDAQLRGTALNVAVNGGVATVSGQVPSVAARYEAFKLTAETPGVNKVNDEMTVQQPEANPATVASTAAPPPIPEAITPSPLRPRVRTRRTARSAESAPEEQQPAPTETAPPGETQPGPEATPPPSAPAAPEPPPIQRVEIPAGTAVNIRMVDAIDSATSHPGEIFHASLDSPLAIGGQVVAPRGTDVYVRLVQAQSAGRLSGQSELRVQLYRMELNGKSYPLVSNDYDLKGTSRGKRSVATVLGGAAIGAAIGAIAGGGKGAAIGAGVGGGGGAVYQGTRHGQQVKIPSETLLNFQLAQPVEVTTNPAGEQTPPSNPQ
ncbi:MAG TPA: BON domain-containing protein [Candidatus Acidoferrales bacterium]|nr:BON domain-containing protein [Candidatus Acidoferrales bacterium]